MHAGPVAVHLGKVREACDVLAYDGSFDTAQKQFWRLRTAVIHACERTALAESLHSYLSTASFSATTSRAAATEFKPSSARQKTSLGGP
jgi:hypothetical protein